MSTIHLATPAAPRVAACGDQQAKRFTFWRWRCTCSTCKVGTAARPFDQPQQQQSVYRVDLPVRYSRLVAYVRAHGTGSGPDVEVAIAEFERDRKAAAHCQRCGPLADPITLYDTIAHRMVFVCPTCSGPGPLHDRWVAGT